MVPHYNLARQSLSLSPPQSNYTPPLPYGPQVLLNSYNGIIFSSRVADVHQPRDPMNPSRTTCKNKDTLTRTSPRHSLRTTFIPSHMYTTVSSENGPLPLSTFSFFFLRKSKLLVTVKATGLTHRQQSQTSAVTGACGLLGPPPRGDQLYTTEIHYTLAKRTQTYN